MKVKPLKVLTVDDDPADAYILKRCLDRIKTWDMDFMEVRNSEAGLAVLAKHPVDIIFLDYLLGEENGLDFVETVRANGDKRPILVLTGQGDERIAATITRAGASDYFGVIILPLLMMLASWVVQLFYVLAAMLFATLTDNNTGQYRYHG